MLVRLRGPVWPAQNLGCISVHSFSVDAHRLRVDTSEWKLDCQPVPAFITSGTLLSAEAYRKTGPFREDFFVECIDFEYSFRLRRAGYLFCLSKAPLMTHASGSGRTRGFFWRKVLLSDHKPERYRWMAKNMTILMKIYPAEFKWLFPNLLKLGLKILLFETQRFLKLLAMIAGFFRAFSPSETLARREMFLKSNSILK